MAKSWACAQQMKDGVLLFLISAVSAEIGNKVSNTNAPRMHIHNAMLRNDTDNRNELAFSKINCDFFSAKKMSPCYKVH